MGVDTVMNAKKIIIMAWSEKKAPIVTTCIEGDMKREIPATYLQEHKNCEFILDKPAASTLTRFTAPWTV
jgi:glucosamine-6-phosphate deaminase